MFGNTDTSMIFFPPGNSIIFSISRYIWVNFEFFLHNIFYLLWMFCIADILACGIEFVFMKSSDISPWRVNLSETGVCALLFLLIQFSLLLFLWVFMWNWVPSQITYIHIVKKNLTYMRKLNTRKGIWLNETNKWEHKFHLFNRDIVTRIKWNNLLAIFCWIDHIVCNRTCS